MVDSSMFMIQHPSATCPGCESSLSYGTKEEASSWKVYYECNDGCGFNQMAGRVKLTDVEHQDEVHDRAREMGEQWTNRNEQK